MSRLVEGDIRFMNPPPLPADAALFLDFDGCLVDIAPTPDAVIVTEALADRLDRLHDRLDGALALISGRNAEDLRGRFPGFAGVIAGSHGAEMSLKPGRIDAAHGIEFDVLAPPPQDACRRTNPDHRLRKQPL